MCDKNEKKKYELVAPDGGWGYLICLTFAINSSTLIMFIGCFGMLYNEFMIEKEINSTMSTLVVGLNSTCFAMFGFLTKSLLNLMSLRKLCLLAVIIHDMGAFGMAFVDSIAPFFLCHGIMMGMGVGISYNLSCSALNEYFVKRRMFAYSIVYFLNGVAITIAPIFVKWSLQEYGYRGTLLLVSGIMMQNIFATMLLQPVRWHMKKVEVIGAEVQQLLLRNKKDDIPIIKVISEENATVEKKGTVAGNENMIEEGKKSTISKVIETFIDVQFAKKLILTCSCVGPAIGTFAESIYSIILPQALYALNWTPDKVALGVSIYGIGDLVMRTVFIFANKWLLKIGSQQVYIVGLFIAGLSRLGMLWSENEIVVYMYISLIGMSRASIVVFLITVLSDVVSPDKFTEAMGLFLLFSGIMSLTFGPAIGAIRDLTNSYNTAFYLLSSCFIIVGIFWSIELCYKMNKDKRKLQKENLEKIRASRLNKGK